MGKRKKIWKNDSQNSYKKPIINKFSEKDMDDEIDAFHKKNDVIPLLQDDDIMESDDDDDEIPVLNYKDIDGDEDEDDENSESDDSENDNGDDEDMRSGRKLEKWEKMEKIMRVKVGGVEDEMDEEEDDDGEMSAWGGKKYLHGADTVDFEIESSDDEAAAMEEAEILRIQRERAKYLSMEDFGLDETDLLGRKDEVSSSVGVEVEDDTEFMGEVIRKDLGALSKEEQMDVVYSFAPELVVLLPSLNETLGQLETCINPLLNKIQGLEKKGRVSFVEVKKILYQVYCQTIVFYLLLKSEGLPVRTHPVIARIVELKGLLNKVYQVEKHLPPEIEGLLHGELSVSEAGKSVLPPDTDNGSPQPSHAPPETRKSRPAENGAPGSPTTLKTSIDERRMSRKEKERVRAESREMLQLRAAMEERLKKEGVSASALKSQSRERRKHLLSKKLETLDDFDDDVEDRRPKTVGSSSPTTLFELVTTKPKNPFRKKVVSGDADVEPREDIGERRRKYEMRILARMGAVSQDGEAESGEGGEPEGEIVKSKKYEKIRADADIFSRDSLYPSLPETVDGKHDLSRQRRNAADDNESEGKIVKNKNVEALLAEPDILSRAGPNPSPADEPVEGKRHISQQMEKNRGLTRFRKKLDKNPRKKYRSKHDKAVMRRKGQVREVRKAKGTYAGEPTGINASISRSVRLHR